MLRNILVCTPNEITDIGLRSGLFNLVISVQYPLIIIILPNHSLQPVQGMLVYNTFLGCRGRYTQADFDMVMEAAKLELISFVGKIGP